MKLVQSLCLSLLLSLFVCAYLKILKLYFIFTRFGCSSFFPATSWFRLVSLSFILKIFFQWFLQCRFILIDFCLYEIIFILSSFSKDIFLGNRISGCQLFSFSILWILFHCHFPPVFLVMSSSLSQTGWLMPLLGNWLGKKT